ncbi:hypothetical protein VitviT2T_021096 [Vitis vinifera]|uniref:FAF domain-containing protein n=1 Tax=Vitis vinifera TaxID=29760 RepID=A0ABY9D5V8_VITVI|nr:protein FANTASTIC FOUR 1 [Vitis vinifera]WKA02950.1 hypothetical protein VitviT2T_021096 [Vitis vinifera]|eukprot:XP_010660073.1 PREDICTED: protein FANTASTIC FOUR 1 [Vitis vinifera]
MMSFCKKSVHSFLGLANSMENVFITTTSTAASPPESYYRCHDAVSTVGGLGFIAASVEIHRPANVVESAAVKTSPPKRDPGGIGFIGDVGGWVDGLMSCTESLGFESSDERRVDDEMKTCYEECWRSKPLRVKSKWRNSRERREARKFPPPLPSLNHNGQPSFFLRSVRKDGRLELTEVRIDRPEILRASRQDGRLTLHLIKEEDNGVEEEPPQEEVQQHQEEEFEEEEEEEKEKEKEHEEDDDFEEEVVEEWRFTAAAAAASSNGGEGLRRCHELVQQHHHHHLHGWSQPCVTSR